MTGRILADLGAAVVKVEPPGGDPSARRFPPSVPTAPPCASWRGAPARPASSRAGADDPRLDELLADADVVLSHPGLARRPRASTRRGAPAAVWVLVTPFGSDGPRAHWRASDLGRDGVDGEHVLHGGPRPGAGAVHRADGVGARGPEAVVATLSALASGRPQVVDVSVQEAVMIASMGHVGRFPRTKMRGKRSGASVGITREIWPCQDGFVSFGLRGGKARVANMQTITRLVAEDGLATPALTDRDWTTYDHNRVEPDELDAIGAPIARVLPATHHGRALRDRSGDQPHAGPGQLPAPAHREPPAGGPVVLLRARARRALPALVRPRHEPRRRRGRAGARRSGPGRTRREGADLAGTARVGPAGTRRARQDGHRGATGPGRGGGRHCGPTGVGGHQPPGVRHRRGRAHRGAVLRRARCHRGARGVALAPRLPAHLRPGAGQPVRARGVGHVRRPQRGEARSHAQPQAPRGRRPGQAARAVGRRGGGELRPPRHAELRPRLRVHGEREARPRHGELVPAGTDRAAQGLPGLRRPGFGPRRLQPPHGLARSRAGGPLRDDHRLPGPALRGQRPRPRAFSTVAARGRACTST